MEIIDIFSKEECDSILKDFESKENLFKISTEHGIERISSYEVDFKNLSDDIKDLILKKIDKVIKPITGGSVGMVFGVRYSLDSKTYMAAHYDCNSYSCVIKINEDYKSGGTYFPLTGMVVNPKNVGQGILFKSDVINSYHEAYPITEGVRYVLVIRMEKNSMFTVLLKSILLSCVDFFIRKFKNKLYKKPLI